MAKRGQAARLEQRRVTYVHPIIEVDVPDELEVNEDFVPTGGQLLHFPFINQALHPRLTLDDDDVWRCVPQLHREMNEGRGWQGPGIGYIGNRRVYAEYGSLGIGAGGLNASEEDERNMEALFRAEAARWPSLVSDHAPANVRELYLNSLAECLRYFDPALFDDATVAFINASEPHRGEATS